jgi:hypothetical protein
LFPDFLVDIFCSQLGNIVTGGQSDTFTFSLERRFKVDGKGAGVTIGHRRHIGAEIAC